MTNGTTTDSAALNLFADHLIAALTTRKRVKRDIYVLDLRGEAMGRLGLKIVRLNTGPRWPKKGPVTTERKVAKQWVRDYYAAWLYPQWKLAMQGRADITVSDACDQYIAFLEQRPVEVNNTLINRRSVCKVHLKPNFGDRVFRELTTSDVERYLQQMVVTERAGEGREGTRPAAMATRANVRTALLAVWHHEFGDTPPPFAGARSRDQSEHWNRTLAADAGTLQENMEAAAYTGEEIAGILATAIWYDAHFISGRPNVAVRVVLNSAALVAVLTGTGARISEALRLRWKNVDWNRKAIFIPGSKTARAARWVPLQETLTPWLQLLQDQQGGTPDPESFLFRARVTDPYRRLGCRTAQHRVSRILRFAGKKRKGKSTHIMRATHSTWALARIPLTYLKLYLGHSQPAGGATDAYIKSGPQLIPAAHRRYQAEDFPPVSMVEAALDLFEPDAPGLAARQASAA